MIGQTSFPIRPTLSMPERPDVLLPDRWCEFDRSSKILARLDAVRVCVSVYRM
ncbi:hypothetical protein Plhal304r1_c052g0135861 [Plasmopara halstedii]